MMQSECKNTAKLKACSATTVVVPKKYFTVTEKKKDSQSKSQNLK